ncbi:uncharacterized protein LOC106181754 [Lingula anatina]|uniref:Uncharacterized protein LOC106181754 n=1 Tax=Lingula anatina TaxID=7574 RepID=A0A1S3KGB8_LINAN|nr:uncharacterized protein LOC106181754 [Lingula anatina]|eukprot:XP_013421685.1 uncharacterized protein LOC106181754 [Lingula anatina]
MTGSVMFTILVGFAIIAGSTVFLVETRKASAEPAKFQCPEPQSCTTIPSNCIKTVTPYGLYFGGLVCAECPVCEIYKYPDLTWCSMIPGCIQMPSDCLIQLPTGFLSDACDETCFLCPVCILTKRIP